MNDLLGMRILIAGGTGFIGSRLVSMLVNEGCNLSIISRKEQQIAFKEVKYYRADLNDISSLQKIESKYDACIYMAANIPLKGQAKESYLDARKTTLDPLTNFCEVFSSTVSKFVYISSIDVLGSCSTVEYDKDTNVNVATPYGLAKFCGEFYVKDYCCMNTIPYIILRFSQVYGPKEPLVRVIPIMKDALINQKEFTIYSDGSELRRFLFIDDAIQAILCALKENETGVFNIAGSEVCSLLELVRKMEKVYDRKLKLKILNNSHGQSNVPAIAKAENLLHYHSNFSVYEGLHKIKMEESHE